MKFLLDMGISPHLIVELRADGHEAYHVGDLSSGRLADAAILAKAREEDHVLLVHDMDFPLLMAASGARSPSVIVFRLRNMRPENVLAFLRKALVTAEEPLMQGAIVSVTEGGPWAARPGRHTAEAGQEASLDAPCPLLQRFLVRIATREPR